MNQGAIVGAEKVKDTLNAAADKLQPEEKNPEKESLLRYNNNSYQPENEVKKED